MLVDTDVLVWNLRGHEGAQRFLDELDEVSISVVTWMELVRGARDQREVSRLRRALWFWNASMIQISARISARAAFLIERHALGDGLEIGGALIAASAIEIAEPLATANHRHYKSIGGLETVRFRP